MWLALPLPEARPNVKYILRYFISWGNSASYRVQACKLKFRLRELISSFCCHHTSHTALEADAGALAEQKQELSSLNLKWVFRLDHVVCDAPSFPLMAWNCSIRMQEAFPIRLINAFLLLSNSGASAATHMPKSYTLAAHFDLKSRLSKKRMGFNYKAYRIKWHPLGLEKVPYYLFLSC